ncbi:MAG: PilW family protein [Planctomycetota bacterium]
MKSRGFTFIEVTIAAAIMTVVAGVGLTMMITGQRMYATSSHKMHASTRVNGVMERMLSEIRMASIRGEDFNNNDDIDDLDLEDINGNGRIDDDWSLPDGETAPFLTFNMALSGGVYGEPVRFRFNEGRVWRDIGLDNTRSIVIARDVKALTFTRQGKRIIIHLVLSSGVVGKSDVGHEGSGSQVSLIREVMIRN